MEVGGLFSLASVGIGINLAFTLIQGVRHRLVSHMEKMLETSRDAIMVSLLEYDNKANNGQSEFVVRLDDIQDEFAGQCRRAEAFFLALAFVSALLLVYFLYEFSLDPKRIVSTYWADVTLALVLGPLIGNFALQILYFMVAQWKLGRKERSFKMATAYLSEVIVPKKP